jgi:hypothetical protein
VMGNDFFLSTKIIGRVGVGGTSYPSFHELILPCYQPNYLGVRVGQRRTGSMLSIQCVQ